MQHTSSQRGSTSIAVQAFIVGAAFFLIWLVVDPLPGGAALEAVARPLLARVIDVGALGPLYPAACFLVIAAFTLAENVAIHGDARSRDWIAGIALATAINYVWVWLALVEAWIAPLPELAGGRVRAEAWQMAAVVLAALLFNFAPQFVWLTAFQIAAERMRWPRRTSRWLWLAAGGVAAAWMLVVGR